MRLNLDQQVNEDIQQVERKLFGIIGRKGFEVAQ
jgi:hypothetical protein